MNINDLFYKSDLITEKILSFLDDKSLAYFGSCCTEWRLKANDNKLWFKLCQLKGFLDYEYLIDTMAHPSIPLKTTTTSPVFTSRISSLSAHCKWRQLIKDGYQRSIQIILGSIIVSTSDDENLIKIWSIEDLDMINCFKSKNDSITCLKIYGEYIVAAGDDGMIKIYDLINGDLHHTFSNNSNSNRDGITKFIINDDKIIAVYTDKSIKAWCLKKFKLLAILRGHTDEIECLSCFENILISGSWDKNVTLWDLNNGTKLADLTGHTEVINCLKIKDYSCLVSGSADSIVKIWNLSISKGLNKKDRLMINSIDCVDLKGHNSDVYCLDVFDNYIASGGADSLVIIWNLNGDLLYRLSGHLGIVRFIHIDRYKLVTGGDAKRILVWDYKNGKLMNTLHRNPNKIFFMNVSDTKIITASPETESNITMICYW
ncbi:unnamed protein product [Brachionus calyciflorus]|uniref:F-box domain-containing protein n=1 Tax=Brachionus calyciflorus TaxID=104777 RepID=A0A814B8R8_9BILA|nr:unnamed protein product [Brachionus calyciflorus]